MRIALRNQLKRQSQVDIALLQDEAMDIAYRLLPQAVFHGGTAIWRCLGANRFSEDLDLYAKTGSDFKKMLENETAKRGLTVTKFRKTENAVFAKISNKTTEVSLEIASREKKNPVVYAFERVDGSSMDVFSLTTEEFIAEKIHACANRRLVRDWYDLFFLTQRPFDFERIKQHVSLLQQAKQPLDEKNLKALIFSGAVPSVSQMRETIWRRLSK